MTRDEIFASLDQLGITRAELTFYGGGDEGNLEDVDLFDKDDKLITEFHITDELSDHMEDLLDEGFDGPDDIRATLTFDVPAKKITKQMSYKSDWTDCDPEEI